MRPRHKAAENEQPPRPHRAVQRASMRPRHKAAENLGDVLALLEQVGQASMRPRHKAAENLSPRASVNTRRPWLQ